MSRGAPPRRLGLASLGLLRRRWLLRALAGAGWHPVPAWAPCDAIGVWGARPVAARGRAIAARRGLPVVVLEDAFLRGLAPADPVPAGLILDAGGAHFDAEAPTELEARLNAGPVAGAETEDALALIRHHALSKYNAWHPVPADLAPGFVLVVDQKPGDASLRGAGAAAFRAMLAAARTAHPGARILIRSHPAAGQGHFGPGDVDTRTAFLPPDLDPVAVLARAGAVHVLSSGLGFDAVLHGHRPVVHGTPWYAGWGLTEDRVPLPRRTARLSVGALVEGSLAACHWFDPATGAPRTLLAAVEDLAARAVAARRLHGPPLRIAGCSRWKRARTARLLTGPSGPPRFTETQPTAIWASKAPAATPLAQVEDGFIRSRGLGAALVPPLSLILDRSGVHFDPARPSDLEAAIARAADLPPAALRRATRLRARLIAGGITKYNTGGEGPLPAQPFILAIGQVADDASIRRGGAPGGDAAVLAAARAAHPGARLVFKPHPDVEAGLRPGLLDPAEADTVAPGAPLPPLLDAAREVWVNTSLAGFEALLRGRPVTCLGVPFYAGWGLTRDLGAVPARRTARPGLDALVHAALIDHPLYLDPRTGGHCGVETVLDRLEAGWVEPRGWRGRLFDLAPRRGPTR